MTIISNFPGSKAKGTAKGTALTQDVLKGKTFSGDAGVDLTGELYVGRGAVAPSELSPWTLRTSAADNYWSSVTYGNGLFVAVAFSGTGDGVMTSPDGIAWTLRTSAADNDWRSVTYGNGLFVAVASSGTGNRVMTARSVVELI